MAFYTYILFSEKTNKYYIGSTADIDKRVEKHNAGATISTKPGRPWKVVYHEEFCSKSESIKREIYFKRMKSRGFIELLIEKTKMVAHRVKASRFNREGHPEHSGLSLLNIKGLHCKNVISFLFKNKSYGSFFCSCF